MRGSRNEGFTLIEMMVVITILSILTVVAMVAYSRYIAKARHQEVIKITANIAQRQGLYFSRYSQYVDTGARTEYWPTLVKGEPVDWALTCPGSTAVTKGFCALGIKPSGQVFFQYHTEGWNENKSNSDIPGGLGIPNGVPWWVVEGRGDMDNDKVYATFRIHSHSGGRLYIEKELE